MADYCVDCADYNGAHDLPHGESWFLCEGCGAHLFRDGQRACRRGPWNSDDATGAPCTDCLDIAERAR